MNSVKSSCVSRSACDEDPIAAPSRNVRRKSAGMSARVAEKASDDAAVRSLFLLNDDAASAMMTRFF